MVMTLFDDRLLTWRFELVGRSNLEELLKPAKLPLPARKLMVSASLSQMMLRISFKVEEYKASFAPVAAALTCATLPASDTSLMFEEWPWLAELRDQIRNKLRRLIERQFPPWPSRMCRYYLNGNAAGDSQGPTARRLPLMGKPLAMCTRMPNYRLPRIRYQLIVPRKGNP